MNIENATMKVDRWDAAKYYRQYREAVKAQAVTDPVGAAKGDDETLRQAYGAIARGEKVIDINAAIGGAGLNDKGLPKLAIARADWEFVFTWNMADRFVFASSGRSWGRADVRRAAHNVAVRFPRMVDQTRDWRGRAQVPMIPAAHRPVQRNGVPHGNLTYYRILFEAEWIAEPPRDPLLLRHLKGPFYVVLAHWDLTEVERGVLRAKLHAES